MSYFGKYYNAGMRMQVKGDKEIVRKLLETGDSPYEGWRPAADIYDTDDGVVVLLEMAGVAPGDVALSVAGTLLRIVGHRREESPRCKKGYRLMEIHHGPFERVLPLPSPTDALKAVAAFKNGILEIYLPHAKKASTDSVGIEITRG